MTSILEDDKLNVIKTEIHCVLVSTKNGLTLKDFLIDYKETVGKPFPNNAFGYKNPMDFLKSIPDVVNISKPCDGPELILPVVKESSAHINKLVLEQKANCKTGRKAYCPRPVQLPTEKRNFVKGPPQPVQELWRKQPTEQTKKNNQLSSKDKKLEAWKSLPIAPRFKEQPVLNVRGWESSVNFSEGIHLSENISMTHISHNSKNYPCSGSFNGLPQQNLGSQSKFSGSYFSKYEEQRHFKFEPHFSKPNHFLPHFESSLSTEPDHCCLKPASSTKVIDPNTNIKFDSLNKKTELMLENCKDKDIISGLERSQQENQICCSQDEPMGETEAVGDVKSKVDLYDDEDEGDTLSSIVGDKMKNNFRLVLQEHLNGILVSKFPVVYEQTFGVSLNHNDLGFKSMQELVMSCPDVFKILKTKRTKQWILFDCRNNKISSDDSSRWIPKQVLENMEELSNLYPKGITSDDILKAYEEHFQSPLDIKKLGFESVTSFLVNCQSIECMAQDDIYLVFPVNWGKKCSDNSVEMDDPIPDLHLSLKNTQFIWEKHFPKSLCDPTFKFENFVMPKESVFKVIVADVIAPNLFYLQDASTFEQLSSLMNDLNLFYDQEEENYKLREDMTIPGLACCLKFMNEWHRAVILKRNHDMVKVLFIDYGTVSENSVTEVRMLHNKFAQLPIQAIKAKLPAIAPINGKEWTPESIECFFTLCDGYVLVAEIISINTEIPSIDVILIDTRGDTDLIIADELILQQHAQTSTTAETSQLKNCKNSQDKLGYSGSFDFSTFPDHSAKLLPSWLNTYGDWSMFADLLEAGKSNHLEGSCLSHSSGNVKSTLPLCCSHHFFAHMFVQSPSKVCEIWNKSVEPFVKNIEKEFARNLCSELSVSTHLKDIKKRSCHLTDKISYLQENCDMVLVSQPFQEEKEALVNGFGHITRSKTSCGVENVTHTKSEPFSESKQLGHSVICARIGGEKLLNFIRFDGKVYVILDELLRTFARLPLPIARYRLLQNKRLSSPITLSPSDKLVYRELKKKRIVEDNESLKIVPLESAGDVLVAVDPALISDAEKLRVMAKECSAVHPYWFI